MGAFLRSFRIQCRVIGALIMRETWTRYGRENLGFAWLFGEFLVFALPVIAIWHFVHGRYVHGLLLVPFVWSGYLPILLFRHIGGHMLRAVRVNMSLFYHRNVTPFDAVFARLGVEILGITARRCFLSFSFTHRANGLAAGYTIAIRRLFLYDLVVRFGRTRYRRIQRTHRHFRKSVAAGIVPVSAGFGLFLSRCLDSCLASACSADLHAGSPCYEMIRGGIFGPVIRVYYDIPQLTLILAAISLFGLLGLRDVRRHLINE